MPRIAADRLNCSSFKAAISGIANSRYLKIMEPIEIENVFLFDLPNFSISVLPINIKLSTLKTVPRINPLATGLLPIRIKRNAITMARINALVAYFI